MFTSRHGMSVCDFCDYEYYSLSGKHTFTATDTSDCQRCPVGTTTARRGSTSLDQCICDIDYYRFFFNIKSVTTIKIMIIINTSPSGKAPCSPCIEGTWTRYQKQQTTCSVKETASPSVSPVPTVLVPPFSPVATSPTQTPSRRPVATRKPTLYPTRNPTTPSDCQMGFFSETGKEPCQQCPPNSINYFSGQSSCLCESGYFSQDGSSPCYACPSGTISDTGSTYCTSCVGFSPCTASYNASAPPVQAPSVPTVYPTQKKPTLYPTQKKPNLRSKESPRKHYVYYTHSPSQSRDDSN